jgi:phosphopantothenoylcysteine decarboxylase/phosphopantothenate--cysteine ligase
MNDEVLKHWSECDIFMGAAAVSDYRPINVSKLKIKKNNGSMSNIELKENPDILSEVGKRKTKKQFVLGFALESKNGEVEAERKLIAKNADAIVLNYANSENIGIAEEENIVTLVTKNAKHQWPLLSKKDIAVKLVDWIQKNSNA